MEKHHNNEVRQYHGLVAKILSEIDTFRLNATSKEGGELLTNLVDELREMISQEEYAVRRLLTGESTHSDRADEDVPVLPFRRLGQRQSGTVEDAGVLHVAATEPAEGHARPANGEDQVGGPGNVLSLRAKSSPH